MLYSQSGEKYSVNGNYLGAPDILGSKNYAPLNFATNSTIRALFTADGNFESWYDSYFKKNVTVDSTITAWEIYAMYRLSVYGDVVVTGIMKSAKLILTDGNITSMTGTINFGSNNLTTTGNVTAGSFNSPSFAGNSRAMLATDTAGNIIRKEYSGNPNEVLTGDGNWSNLSQSTGWQWVDTNLVSTAAQVVVANNLAVGGKISVGQMKVISNGSNKDTLHTEKELVIITDSKNISLEDDTVKIPRLLDSKRMETDTLNSKKINASKIYVAGDITSTGTVYTGNLYVANDVMLPLFTGAKNLLLTDSTGKVSPLGISSTSNKVLLSNGTWGAVPIPQNYWQMQGDDIYTLTPGNIGLGMNNPAYKLDVAGTVRISEDLLVGGGIIISEKVNATRELKSASLRADSIFMDNTKAFYGESRFADSVKIQSKLRVDGNIDAGGDLRSSGSLIFGSNKNISYFPHQNGITGDLCFGTQIPAFAHCYPPVIQSNQNWFGGSVNVWGNLGWDPSLPSSVLKLGSDGANGLIEIEGTNSQGGESHLLLNFYCGRNVVVGGDNVYGASTGNLITNHNAYLAVIDGNVGIGTNSPAQDSKLHIREMGGTPVYATVQNDNGSVKMGFRLSRGTIDSESSSSSYGELLLNCFTGKDVVIGGNPGFGINSGDLFANHNAYLAAIDGKVRIGSNQPATTKLDIDGDVRISVLTTPTGTYNVVVADGTGLLGTKTAIEIGDNLGDHTATGNIIMNTYCLSSDGSNNGIFFSSDNKVGIGTDQNLTERLNVNGYGKFYGTGSGGNTGSTTIGFNGMNGYLNTYGGGLLINYYSGKDVVVGGDNVYGASTGNFFANHNAYLAAIDGNVGIGSTNPSAKLHVNGISYFNDNVGIGISNPTSALYIQGSLKEKTQIIIDNTTQPYNSLKITSFNRKATISSTSDMVISIDSDGNENNEYYKIITNSDDPAIALTKFSITSDYVNTYGKFRVYDGSSENTVTLINNNGHITCRKVIVRISGNIGDFVFDKNYKIPSLYEEEDYYKTFSHLKGIPSAAEVIEKGMDIDNFISLLLQKIETTVIQNVQQQKEIDSLKKQVDTLEDKLNITEN